MITPAGALILAAGFGSRFGGAKLSALLDNGQPVLQQTLHQILAADLPVVVVSRPEVITSLSLNPNPRLRLLSFTAAERGMGASLAFGIRQVDDWNTCLVCLADMPFIASATYRTIVDAARSDNIVVPQYDSRSGNPVAFGRQFYARLRELDGDAGGRHIISAFSDRVLHLPVTDPGILADIDTPADLVRLQQ